MQNNPVITKETKNRIVVDYEGKLSFKERMKKKFSSSNTWILILINIFRFVLMLGVSFVILYPFLTKFAGSFMSKEDVIDATVSLIPKHPNVEIYKALFTENRYLEAFGNTLFLSLVCALLQTFVACLVGYGLAKFRFKGNKIVMVCVIVTMVIPHSALELSMIQHFTHFDLFSIIALSKQHGIFELIMGKTFELTDTFAPIIILSVTGLGFKNGLYIYMMRQFFKGVPDELEESAYVDGSGTLRTFFQVILPLSIPMMITIFLFAFSWQWTDEFYTTIFYPQGAIYLMPKVCKTIPETLTTSYAGKALYENIIQNTAGLMVIAPLVILYLFCQRYLVQGIERSGLVG